MSLPAVTTFEYTESKLLCVHARNQITSLIRRSKHYTEESWSRSDKSPLIPGIPHQFGRSSFIQIPEVERFVFSLQCSNLPPKLRSAFQNISLLAIWYGSTKPNWSRVLSQEKFEVEALMQTQEDPHLGKYRCKILFWY